MGRPVLYLTGSGELGGGGDPSSLATIAATVILGEVAKRVASYGADIKIPHRAPIVMAICQEMVRESYLAAGRPDAYKEDANFFITRDQFAYTAAVDGMMLREKPAANFFMGYYYAESLLLAETGAATGAIQIAGTDAEHQLPFFRYLYCFLVLEVLRWFTSLRCPPQPMDSAEDPPGLAGGGYPIRESPGQSLFAAHRGFSQLTTPFIDF